jgi:NAD(P)-dependent dehydrogenase (short-subunit alcohol dehydrogenase family)
LGCSPPRARCIEKQQRRILKYMKTDVEGKVALVTGSASGIGRVTARLFAKRGAKVIVTTDANIKGAEETVALIRDAGGKAIFIKCDVSKEEDVAGMISEAVKVYGSLDYAFNNAGIGPDGVRIPIVNVADCAEDIWDRTLNINLKGVFLCMKYEIRQMLKQKHGSIVNTSSVGAFKPLPGFAAYDASKTGLIGLTKAAALEVATSGIRINLVCPGPTERTRLIENLTSTLPEEKERTLSIIPMRRMAEPEEIAEAVIWLCSDAASFITGHVMPIDGGMTSA